MSNPRRLSVDQGLALAGQALDRGDLTEAIQISRQILSVDTENADALHIIAVGANKNGKPERALEIVDRALASRPDDPGIRNTRGLILLSLNRLAEAEQQLRACIADTPDFEQALYNLAAVKERQNEMPDALTLLDRADERHGVQPTSMALRASILQAKGEFTEALEIYDQALKQDPDNRDIRFSRANLLLLLGRMQEGWPDFELRRHRALGRSAPVEKSMWSGEMTSGTRLLVYSEHGQGDVIQFSRYIPYLLERGLKVAFDCPARTVPLMQTLKGAEQLDFDADAFAACDFVAPIMSLPYLLGHAENQIAEVAAATPYLHPEDSAVAEIKTRLAAHNGLKVGIAWQGNPNQSTDRDRSIPIKQYEGLMALDGVTLVSLQKINGESDIDPYRGRYTILDWPDTKEGFYKTACLMKALDLVVTSDTAVAHLAGALGVRCWLLLSARPSWRWLLERADSPWYPTLRLFRQTEFRDWGPVFLQVEAALAELVAEQG